MGLVDIEAKGMALKITWLKVLSEETELQAVVYQNIQPIIREKIWNCNLKPEDVHLFITEPFWKDVFTAWFTFKQKNDNLTKVEQQIIWLNSNIRIAGMPLLWKKGYEKGLLYINQLFADGKIISKEDALARYGLSVMSYNSLVDAIPVKLKACFKTKKQMKEVTESLFIKAMLMRKDTTRIAYDSFIKPQSLSNFATKWAAELDINVEVEEILENLRNVTAVTNIPKYRSFQYRLIYRAIMTNMHLFRWNIIENNLCGFCGKSKETYKHLFVWCEHIKPGWIRLKQKMYEFDDTDILFNESAVMFNKLVDSNPKNVKNFICLMFKQYIYRQRCFQKDVKMEEFYKIIYYMKKIEKYIAQKNNTLRHYAKKWVKDENLC